LLIKRPSGPKIVIVVRPGSLPSKYIVRSDKDDMSAMPGFAMEISAKGSSLSTTMARFIGTANGADAEPRTTRNVSAYDVIGILPIASDRLATAAFMNLSYFIVTCLSDHALAETISRH
jgi:hypothetical protein